MAGWLLGVVLLVGLLITWLVGRSVGGSVGSMYTLRSSILDEGPFLQPVATLVCQVSKMEGKFVSPGWLASCAVDPFFFAHVCHW